MLVMQRLSASLNSRVHRLIPLALTLVLVTSIIGPGEAKADPGWYDTDWSYRKKITLNSANISGSDNLTSFPVLISLVDTDLRDDALNNGDDIIFTAGDEVTRLEHEVESYNGTSGNLTAWVMIPSLSATSDTEIYMYYGHAGAGNSENAPGVWDANYKMVQHLEETSGGSDAITDSTSNSHDGTDYNTPTFSASGQIDGAIDFDKPSGEYIQLPNTNTILNSDNLTVEAWFKTTTNHPEYGVGDMEGRIVNLQRDNVTVSTGVSLYAEANMIGLLYYNGSVHIYKKYTVNYWDGVGHHVAATHRTADNTWRLYFDGAQVATEVDSFGDFGAHPANIGTYDGTSRYFDGLIDEVRISNTARDADWIQTSYNNQSNPGDFLTPGVEENAPSTPTVTTNAATNVEETTATINGTLTNDGGEACQYRFQWGSTQGGPYTDNTSWTGSLTTGQQFSEDITGLEKGTKYYFIAEAKNAAGTGSGSELSFLTKPDAPTSFSAITASSSQINLSWTKGDGANQTLIRRKEGSYPTHVNDGDEVYFDTGESTQDTGLMPSTTYFYSAWSEVSGSQQWSDNPAQANATTTSGAPTVIGGLVLPINKATVLAPWVLLGAILSLVTVRLILHFRKKRGSAYRH